MARPRKIDRDVVLDAAEVVVQQVGPTGFSLDAVAKEAGISKGGIQSSFGTKDGLLDAMLERWEQSHEKAIHAHTNAEDRSGARVRAHIRATVNTLEAEKARTAALLSALVQSKGQHAEARKWYASVIGNGKLDANLDRSVRLAFIAAEGLFFLKHFDLVDLPDEIWDEVGQDVLALLAGKALT
jgi:AcrR family transcriptional regulator